MGLRKPPSTTRGLSLGSSNTATPNPYNWLAAVACSSTLICAYTLWHLSNMHAEWSTVMVAWIHTAALLFGLDSDVMVNGDM